MTVRNIGKGDGALSGAVARIEAAGEIVVKVVEEDDQWVLLTQSGRERVRKAVAPPVEERAPKRSRRKS